MVVRTKILTLVSNPLESRAINKAVTDAGYECVTVMSGKALVNALSSNSYDLLIFDWDIHKIAGMDIIKRVRESVGDNIAMIVITERLREEDIVLILMAGADVCIAKPFRHAELLARIHSLSRRRRRSLTNNAPSITSTATTIEVSAYSFDLLRKTVSVQGEQIYLKPKEFDLAVFFFKNIGMLLSRKQIFAEIWGNQTNINSRTLDTHASLIRTKLQLKPENKIVLSSFYTIGYQLDVI